MNRILPVAELCVSLYKFIASRLLIKLCWRTLGGFVKQTLLDVVA